MSVKEAKAHNDLKGENTVVMTAIHFMFNTFEVTK